MTQFVLSKKLFSFCITLCCILFHRVTMLTIYKGHWPDRIPPNTAPPTRHMNSLHHPAQSTRASTESPRPDWTVSDITGDPVWSGGDVTGDPVWSGADVTGDDWASDGNAVEMRRPRYWRRPTTSAGENRFFFSLSGCLHKLGRKFIVNNRDGDTCLIYEKVPTMRLLYGTCHNTRS